MSQEGTESITTYEILKGIEEIDLSFTNTYYQIAQTGQAWDEAMTWTSAPENADLLKQIGYFFDQVGEFFNAVFQSIKIIFTLISEIFSTIYDCIRVFAKFVGFIPGT